MQTSLDLADAPGVTRGRKLVANVAEVLVATGTSFRTRAVASVAADHEGLAGDLHRGFIRSAGAREPWYQRGTPMRSGRQLSIVSHEELEEVARLMALPKVEPSWIGANLVVEGIPHFSFLPAGTILFFSGGATAVIEGQNAPCRSAGGEIAAEYPDREGIALDFARLATRRRGIVASIERAGAIEPGKVDVRVPEQWIWS
jgi:hypothetical protein